MIKAGGYRVVPYRPFRPFGAVLAVYSSLPAIVWAGNGSLWALLILFVMVRASIWCFERKASR